MKFRILLIFQFVLVAFIAQAQQDQEDLQAKTCKYELFDKIVWNFVESDTLEFLKYNCVPSSPKFVLYNRWGSKLIEKNEAIITRNMFEVRPEDGTYFGVFSYTNSEGEKVELKLIVTIV